MITIVLYTHTHKVEKRCSSNNKWGHFKHRYRTSSSHLMILIQLHYIIQIWVNMACMLRSCCKLFAVILRKAFFVIKKTFNLNYDWKYCFKFYHYWVYIFKYLHIHIIMLLLASNGSNRRNSFGISIILV